MPGLNNARSVLAVRGLYASVAFFQEKLGLTIDFSVDGWCFLSRDGFGLMMKQPSILRQ